MAQTNSIRTEHPSRSVGRAREDDIGTARRRRDGEDSRRRRRRWPRLEPEREEREPKGLKALLARLKRRKLGEWVLAYLALAWIALQMTDSLREIWDWPNGPLRGITLALALGAFPTAIIAWYHGEKGRQKVCVLEIVALGALLLASGWLIWFLCA